jgi:glycine amidinotransferase
MQQANSYDEWTQLREVVVGIADDYLSHELDASFRLFYFDNVPVPPEHGHVLPIPQQLLEELQEDLQGFVAALEACSVSVIRPAALGKRSHIASPFWTALETPPLNVRDQAIVLGHTLVETAPHVRSRLFENDYLKPILYPYFRAGSRWLSMPRPSLARGSLDPSYFVAQGVDPALAFDDSRAAALDGLGFEIVFDGAQCIRLGRDVLVNVANANHALGLAWLRSTFGGEFRFHELRGIADSHIDSIVVPLRPGLLLLRSPQYRAQLPDSLQRWDVVYPPEASDSAFPDYSDFGFNLASRYIDINVLSINETTVIVNSLCPDLIASLEARGQTVIPVQHRHRRLFSGGFHCFTLDTVRSGGPEDYLA